MAKDGVTKVDEVTYAIRTAITQHNLLSLLPNPPIIACLNKEKAEATGYLLFSKGRPFSHMIKDSSGQEIKNRLFTDVDTIDTLSIQQKEEYETIRTFLLYNDLALEEGIDQIDLKMDNLGRELLYREDGSSYEGRLVLFDFVNRGPLHAPHSVGMGSAEDKITTNGSPILPFLQARIDIRDREAFET